MLFPDAGLSCIVDLYIIYTELYRIFCVYKIYMEIFLTTTRFEFTTFLCTSVWYYTNIKLWPQLLKMKYVTKKWIHITILSHTRLEYGRSWVQALMGSNKRLTNRYLLHLSGKLAALRSKSKDGSASELV